MDPEHVLREMERADEVPQTLRDGPLPTEEAALSWIDNALTHRNFVDDKAPSRENSLVRTKLEEAKFWAEKDIEKKSLPDV